MLAFPLCGYEELTFPKVLPAECLYRSCSAIIIIHYERKRAQVCELLGPSSLNIHAYRPGDDIKWRADFLQPDSNGFCREFLQNRCVKPFSEGLYQTMLFGSAYGGHATGYGGIVDGILKIICNTRSTGIGRQFHIHHIAMPHALFLVEEAMVAIEFDRFNKYDVHYVVILPHAILWASRYSGPSQACLRILEYLMTWKPGPNILI